MATTRTSRIWMRPIRGNSRRAFTLVEIILVVTVLALVSAMVAPTLVSMRATSERRAAMSGLRHIAADAREQAIRRGLTTELVYDESLRQFQIVGADSDGTSQTFSTQNLPEGLEPQRFQMEGEDVAAVDFRLRFSPDGHSNGGGIEFNDFSILVDQDARYRLLDGALPSPQDQSWEAGQLEQRG